jgi:hypothetical protein
MSSHLINFIYLEQAPWYIREKSPERNASAGKRDMGHDEALMAYSLLAVCISG